MSEMQVVSSRQELVGVIWRLQLGVSGTALSRALVAGETIAVGWYLGVGLCFLHRSSEILRRCRETPACRNAADAFGIKVV